MPNAQACFYENVNFSGRYVCVNIGNTITNLANYNLNDRVSSISIPVGYTLTVYVDSNFRGEGLTLQGDIYDISAYGYEWNDIISSIDFRY